MTIKNKSRHDVAQIWAAKVLEDWDIYFQMSSSPGSKSSTMMSINLALASGITLYYSPSWDV